MSKQSLLLVDGDTRSLRVLEVSLRNAGFTITPAATVEEATEALKQQVPDLIISETAFSSPTDGFAFRDQIRRNAQWAEIPFVFLTAETTLENKIRGLELGVDDYLTKPIYIKEVIARINILLHKHQRAEFAKHSDGVQFSGRLADLPVVDVIQTIEVSRKSGVIQFVTAQGRASIYFRDGKVIDAEAGMLQGEDAVYRLLTWNDGEFDVVFRTVRRREVITASSQALLMEGMRRLDEWSRLVDELPPLTRRFTLDTVTLAERLGDIPDENNSILRLFDGKRSLLEVIEASSVGDLECLQAISRLFFEGLLLDVDPAGDVPRPPARQPEGSGPVLAPVSAAYVAANLSRAESAVDPEPVPVSGGVPMKLIEEAVSAVQADDISPMEVPPAPVVRPSAPLARVRLTTRGADPRIANARVAVERQRDRKVPSLQEEEDREGDADALSNESPIVRSPIDDNRALSPVIEITGIPGDRPAETVEVGPGPRSMDQQRGPGAVALAPERPTTSPPALDGSQPAEASDAPASAEPRDEVGMKMIGSHGRERATAAGELNSAEPSADQPPARELITIMPRRTTRNPFPATAVPAVASQESPQQPKRQVPPASKLRPPVVAGGVRQPDSARPLVMAAVVLGACLVGVVAAVYWSSEGGQRSAGAPSGPANAPAALAGAVAIDAARGAIPGDAAPDAATPTLSSGMGSALGGSQVPVSSSAVAIEVGQATLETVSDAGAAPDRDAVRAAAIAEARRLYERAHAALEEGDARKALELASASLKLRKTARTYLEYARALQRLGQVEEALEAVESAIEIVPTYAPSWSQRGMILWASRRREEARLSFEKYLALDPNGRDAVSVRQMLSQP